MDPQLVARVLAFLPPVVGFLWILRMGSLEGKAGARVWSDLVGYVQSQRLTLGPNASERDFTFGGTYEGLPLSVDTPSVASGKSTRTVTRITLRLDAGSGAGERCLVVGSSGTSPDLAELSGLAEQPSGDPAFDARFKVYLPQGARSPAEWPAFRRACLDLDRQSAWAIDRVSRSATETSVVLRSKVLAPAALDRGIRLASALASPDRAHRAEASLLTPVSVEEPVEVRKAGWHTLPFTAGLLGAITVGPMLTIVNPLVHQLAELVACDPGQRLVTIGTGRKGGSFVCLAEAGQREGANLWTFLVGLGLHFFVFALLAILLRAAFGKRRAG